LLFSGQLIRLAKYADFLVVLTKKTTVIQGMIDRITETGRCFRIDEKIEKNRGKENLKATNLSTNYDRSKITAESNLEYIIQPDGQLT